MEGFPSSVFPRLKDPLVVQVKHITRLGSLRLDQDMLRLTLKVKSFPSFTMPDGMDKLSRLTFQTGSQC